MILLDLMLPKISGEQLCSKWRQDGMQTPIIMLTAKSEELGGAVPKESDIAGLKRRSRVAPVYLAKSDDGKLEQLNGRQPH